MSLAEVQSVPNNLDYLEAGARFGIKQNGRAIIDRIADALGNWPRYAKEAGVPPDLVQSIGTQFRVH